MKFDLDDQQRDFASSIDAALGAADLPAAVRAWADGDTGPGRKVWSTLADLGVTALNVAEEHDGIGASPWTSWWLWNGWATGASRDRSPNPLRSPRSCCPPTSVAPRWPPVNWSPPSAHRHSHAQSTQTSPA